MRLVGLFLLLFTLVAALPLQAQSTVRLKGPKELENPVRSRVGPLTASDTLWRIAEETRAHSGLNMYQMMYAIYLKNPEAFLDDNFNHLMPGAFLTIPSSDEVLAVDAGEARRKSEEDDRVWAQRVRSAAALKVAQGQQTAKQQDVTKARDVITSEIGRVEGSQKIQLQDLQRKLAESSSTVESVLADNHALKQKLDSMAEHLLKVQAQVDQDSEIQQQLETLVLQQAEMLEQQRLQIAREQEGGDFSKTWQQLSNSTLAWVILGITPVLILLGLVLAWLKRRLRKTEEVVSAATAVPQQDPHYRSPLPPLDESLDFDESSLMALDESLLGPGSLSTERFSANTSEHKTDLVNPNQASPFDDVLLEDDDLLDTSDLLLSTTLENDLMNDLLDEAEATNSNVDFDPDNILTSLDLGSLMVDELPTESSDDLFAQAVADQLAEEAKNKEEQGVIELSEESLTDLEEIELDDVAFETSSELDESFQGLDPEVDNVDFDSLLEELQAESSGSRAILPEASVLTSPSGVDSELDEVFADPNQFNSKELEAFAETLVNEEFNEPWSNTSDESAELENVASSLDSLDELTSEVVLLEEVESLEEAKALLETEERTSEDVFLDEDEFPLTSDEVALLLSDEEFSTPILEPAADNTALSMQKSVAQEEAPFDELSSPESDTAWQELSEVDASLVQEELLPDLTSLEDTSVSQQSEGAQSVEKPSLMLEDYPDLELNDALLDELEEELAHEQEFLFGLESDVPDEAVATLQSEEVSDEATLDELTHLDEIDFDALLADFSEEEGELELTSQHQTAQDILKELDEHAFEEEEKPQVEVLLADEQEMRTQDTELLESIASKSLAQSLRDLDVLLQENEEAAALSQEVPALTVDVGLEDYKDFIASQSEEDITPDPLELIYGADLDLIRAYLEIGEEEGAQQLIEKMLRSDLPEGIRSEVEKLKQQLS